MKNTFCRTLALCLCALLVCFCVGCGADTNGDETETTASALVADPKLEESRYKLGDKMGDYTLTDVKGNTYRFSDILQEKQAIVLNFWYINCGPCKMEFPYLDEAYQLYKDSIEVLAINTVDTAAEIEEFAQEQGLSFPMIAGDAAWESSIDILGFPTTIIVDRFGTVSMVHTGYLDSTETFSKVFEFFTAESYEGTTVKSINEIN